MNFLLKSLLIFLVSPSFAFSREARASGALAGVEVKDPFAFNKTTARDQKAMADKYLKELGFGSAQPSQKLKTKDQSGIAK